MSFCWFCSAPDQISLVLSEKAYMCHKWSYLLLKYRVCVLWFNAPLTTLSWRRDLVLCLASSERLEEWRIEPATLGLQGKHAYRCTKLGILFSNIFTSLEVLVHTSLFIIIDKVNVIVEVFCCIQPFSNHVSRVIRVVITSYPTTNNICISSNIDKFFTVAIFTGP